LGEEYSEMETTLNNKLKKERKKYQEEIDSNLKKYQEESD